VKGHVARDCKPDPLETTRLGGDGGVDPRSPRLKVQERAAAVSGVDGGVGLEIVLVATWIIMPVRCLALMMPWVTVSSRPRGWPMATTHSPTSTLSESPKVTWGAAYRRGSGSRRGPSSDPSHHLTRVFGTVRQEHLDLRCSPHDVVVGQDVALASMIIPVPSPFSSRLNFRGMRGR